MRGRNILAEPCSSSICAFCAHRLHVSKPVHRVQRRFLQGSQPASKPPATGAAHSDYNNAQSISESSNKWSAGRTGSLKGFGRPAFGKGTVSNSSNESNGRIEPSFSPGMIELTEEEKRARELVNATAEKVENKPRQLRDVYPSPGPESSRAGRPMESTWPDGWNSRPHDEGKKRALELNMRNRHRSGVRSVPTSEGSGFTITNLRHFEERRLEMKFSQGSRLQSETNNPWSDWNHLKKRSDDEPRKTSSVSGYPITDGQTQPGNLAKASQFVPLISNSRGREDLQWPERPQHSSSPRPQADDGTYLAKSAEYDGFSAASEANNKTAQYQPLWRSTGNKSGESDSTSEVGVGDGVNSRRRGHLEASIFAPKGDERRGDGRRGDEWRGDERRVSRLPTRGQELGTGRGRKMDWIDEEQASNSRATFRKNDRDKLRRRDHFLNEDEYEDEDESSERSITPAMRAVLKKQKKQEAQAKRAAAPTPIFLPEYISTANLAAALRVRVHDLVLRMEELGFEETGHDFILSGEDAGLIAMEYNFEAYIDRGDSEDLKPLPMAKDQSNLPSRPPIVTIMGHVDHGKTTLLDFLRKSSVAATEHGGITQHIGAFSVRMTSGKLITFLDTPGHAAFLSMRQRGANVTDIVVLVVAADDSVKPQTIEAVKHAQAANVPIVVAINKIDKDEANVEKVKQDLARHGIEIEDYGGDTQVVCVSGKTGQGLEQLDESVTTLSEMLDLRAEVDGQAEGWVLEASIKSMGKVATVLVRRGTMRPGDSIVAGTTWARIRCIRDQAGIEIAEAGPGMPVQIDGWKEQPVAGDEVLQAPDESKAKSVINYRLENRDREKMVEDIQAINEARKLEHGKREREKLEEKLAKSGEESTVEPETPEKSGPKYINFIIKGDVSGSVEAVVESVLSIGSAEVQARIIRSGVGQISEFDVEHAAVAQGYLINFNTNIDPRIAQLAEAAKVKIINHKVIYRLVESVKATLSTYLKPLVTHRVLGEVEVSQIFSINIKGRKQKPVAGCKVKNGTIMRNSKVWVFRGGKKIFDGLLASLKNLKKDVTEVRKGSECGLSFEGWDDIRVGDQIQAYEVKEEKRYL